MIGLIIGCVCMAWVLTEWAEFVALKLDKPRIMYYVCVKCYSFWLTAIVSTIVYGWKGILMGAIGGLIGYLLDKGIERIEL